MNTANVSSFLNTANGRGLLVMDMVAWRRRRRVLARVTRAAWRLEQAERERAWALASAKAEGVSIRQIAQAAGLSPSRVHQVVAGADVDALDDALGALRSAGWPAPEDPDGDDDDELSGRADVAGRLEDEVQWIRQCADWLEHLDQQPYPSVVNLRPESDWPRRYNVVADIKRVVAILRRIAYDVAELARARDIDDLTHLTADDPRAERRRRAAEPDLDFVAFCARRKIPYQSTPQLERAYDAFNTERFERGETDQGSWEAYNPVREARNRSGNWTR